MCLGCSRDVRMEDQKPDVDHQNRSIFQNTPNSTASPAEKAPHSDLKHCEAPGPLKPPRNVTGFAWNVVVVSIMSSTLLFALDNTITADVQPAIVKQFNSISKLPWIAVSFMLGAASINFFWRVVFVESLIGGKFSRQCRADS